MSNKEFFLRTTKLNESSGGVSVGKIEGTEGSIVMTKYGFFSAELTDQGDLFTHFSDNGIICIYNDKGELDTVSINVEDYLCTLSDEEIDDMPNSGDDIMRAMDFMIVNDKQVIFTVRIKAKMVEIVTFGKKKDEFSREMLPFKDLDSAVNGFVTINGTDLPFAIIRNSDEFTIGLGEASKTKRVINATILSNSVNFIDDVLAGGSRDLQNLAGKILLN